MKRPKGSATRKIWDTLQDVVLGIDIGSTSTRLCLYCPTSGNEVEVDAGFVGDPNRFEPGDFSTSCYPFDNGYAYIGNKPGRGRLATSLKPVFLLLCDLDEHDLEPLIAEYPHSKELLSRIRQPGHIVFRRKLTTAVRNFFDCLGKRTIEACEHYGFKITAVGISDPGQWPAAVEDYMADMFLENFNRGPRSPHFPIARDNVFFHGETQALAHFFFRPHANNPRVFHSKTGVFLLADFGGQNLNISTYYVLPGLAGGTSFFEMGFSTGVAGGSELQDYYIGRHCEDVFAEDGHQLSRSDKQQLMNGFHEKKRELDANHHVPKRDRAMGNVVVLHCDSGNNIRLSPTVMRGSFDFAMQKPIELFTQELQRWSGLAKHHAPQVIIAGGTARSLALQQTLKALCRQYKMESPIFIDKLVARHRSFNVAKGAAYATANDRPPGEFITRGAAIGVQKWDVGKAVWNADVDFLCDAEHQATKVLKLVEGDQLKLICNPLLPNLSRPDTFSYDEAYDIHHIGALREGRAEVTASFNLGGQRPTLLFDIRWWPKRDWRPRGAEPFSGSVSLPLWFHRSSSCVLPILEEIQDNLPPEALVGYDATLDMHADTYDAQMHGPFEPPKNSPFSDTQTEIPDTEMYDDDGPHTQYPPPSNMQTDIPAIEMVEEHAPPTQYTPAANANTQMYDEHGPPSQYFPHVGMSTDNHLIEMNNEYRPPTQSPPVSNTQRDIPVAESYLGHRASASVAPRGNTQLDPIDLSTSETGADEETSYTEEIRGSRKISRETETAGRYSGARFTL